MMRQLRNCESGMGMGTGTRNVYCYRLTIAYDGTRYSGWQIQPNAVAIQALLQQAISTFLSGAEVTLVGSGRTDAGVHAINQFAHFKLSHAIDPQKLLFALTGLLPPDIRVKDIERVSPEFHAQYSAISKEYHYHLYLEKILDPFRRLYVWHVRRKIDLALLQQAAFLFLGTHDFTSFANEPQAGSVTRDPVRTLYRLDLCPEEGGLRLEFEGDGFLYKMVRNIVGTLIEVASERMALSELKTIFAAKDRRMAGPAAPPQGLFLYNVNYKSMR